MQFFALLLYLFCTTNFIVWKLEYKDVEVNKKMVTLDADICKAMYYIILYISFFFFFFE